MKAKEHIFNLRDNLRVANSSLLDKTDQHLMFMLDEARSILISRKIANRHNIDNMIQYCDILPSKANSNDLAIVGEEELLKVIIPKPISLNDNIGIFSVGNNDARTSYAKIDYGRIRTYIHRKYTSKTPVWIYSNDTILILNSVSGLLTKVRVRGVFDEPWRIEKIKGNINPLNPFDFEYPLSLKDSNAVYDLAMSGDLSWGDFALQSIARKKAEANKRAETR
jgi:hypothetical protein